MTKKQLKQLIKSQQGEIDAVPMYLKLSSIAPNKHIRDTFKQLAAEEGHHASVFFKMTNKTLQPRKIKAILLGVLAHIVGWKILLYLIAQGEYSAYRKYGGLIKDFPEVNSVRDDENRHGDIMLAMRKELKDSKSL